MFELDDDALYDDDAGTPQPRRKCLRVRSFVRRVVETEPDEAAQMPAPALGQCGDAQRLISTTPACRWCESTEIHCDAGLCKECCHKTSCWIGHTYTSSEDEANQPKTDVDQDDKNDDVPESEPDEAAQMPAPALGQCGDCKGANKPGDLCEAGLCRGCCDGASCWPSNTQGIGAAPAPTTASPAAAASASPTAGGEDDDCTYSQEEVQDAARAYMEDSTNFRSDSTNSESWDGLVDAIAEKFDEVEPGATAHASCCLWGLSSIVWQHLQTIFGIALCVKCLTPRS